MRGCGPQAQTRRSSSNTRPWRDRRAAVGRALEGRGQARELALAPHELGARDPLRQIRRPPTARVYDDFVYVRWKSSSQFEPSNFSQRPVIVLPSSENVPMKRCENSGDSRDSSQVSSVTLIA
jgi:hypothetical protein